MRLTGAGRVGSEGSLDRREGEGREESWVGVGGDTPSRPGLVRAATALAWAVFTVKPTWIGE